MTKKILAYFLSWKLLIYIFALLALFYVPQGDPFFYPHPRFRQGFPYLIWVWGNFDGHHYMEIAERGYQNLEQAFFPLFPILINTLNRIFGMPFIIAGQLVSNLSLLISLFVIVKLLKLDGQQKLIPLFFLAILLFPTSFFYQAVYNDSLFLLLASLTIYLGRKRSFVLASVFGSLATLARLNGLALFVYLVFEYAQTISLKKAFLFKNILQSKFYSSLLIPATLVGYLFYIQNKFGNWRLLFTNLEVWNLGKVVFPLQVFFRYAKILAFHTPQAITYWVAVIELLFVLFYIFLLFYSFKKIRLSYWIFFAVSVLIPTLTGSFIGMPRYGLHLYPLFLSAAIFLSNQNKVVQLLFVTVSLVLFFVGLALFTRGYFIA